MVGSRFVSIMYFNDKDGLVGVGMRRFGSVFFCRVFFVFEMDVEFLR